MRNVLRSATCAALMLAICSFCETARGGVHASVRLPANVTVNAALLAATGGLLLDVDANWVQGYGHIPVHLKLHTLRPEPEDRKLTVELGTGFYAGNNDVVVSTDLTLPAGETQVEKWIPVPQGGWGQVLSIRSFVGRRLIEPLSSAGHSFNNFSYDGRDASVPRMLFVADQPPDISGLRFTTSSQSYSPAGTNNLQDYYSLTQHPRDRLFGQWIFYSGIDLTFLSLDDARHLAANQPKVWRALGDWTRSGGVLCVFGTGRDEAKLAEVEALLGAGSLQKDPPAPDLGWESPAADVLENQVKNAIEAQLATDAQLNPNSTAPTKVTLTPPADPPFIWRQVGMGHVVALPPADPFPGTESDWRWMLATVAHDTSRWSTRYGVQADSQNPAFNEFLIADVGLPPIGAYRVLITLFVVLIGPVNYWLLRRAGRLHLFLFTVPLAALVTSGALLGYALLSDGLISRLRARSFTVLDQPAARATTAARVSYYVGFASSAGLTFPDDTLIVPFELQPRAYYSPNFSPRRMTWSQQQHLTQGWLASRTPTQYVTQRNYPTEQRLDLSPASDGKLSAINRLGVPVIDLIVRDKQGAWHAASNLAAGEPGQLALLADEAALEPVASRFLKTLGANNPSMPAGLTAYGSSNSWRWFGASYMTSQKTYGLQSLLEQCISQVRTQILARELPPGSYVAIVERPAEVIVGIDNPVETQSTHVIQGRW